MQLAEGWLRNGEVCCRWTHRLFPLLILGVLSLGLTGDAPEPEQRVVGVPYGNEILVPSNQLLAPAGQRVQFRGRPVDLALSPTGNTVAVLLPNLVQLFSPSGELLRSIRLRIASLGGLAFTPDGAWVASSQANGAEGGDSIALADVSDTVGVRYLPLPLNSVPAGLASDASGENLYVALNRLNAVGKMDLRRGELVQTVSVGVAPFGVAITPQGDRLFVTNWGGQHPTAADPRGISSGTATLVDARGIASSGTVSVIDPANFNVIAEIPVGLHPSGIQIRPDGGLAAIANANSDSVTLLDTRSLQVVDTIPIPAFPSGYFGSSPATVAFSPNGNWLYVACAGNNAVAVLERDGFSYALRGFVPTDWYPVALAVGRLRPDAETVYVANSKGIGSRSGVPGRYSVLAATGTINIFPGGTASITDWDSISFVNDPFRNAVTPENSPQNLRALGIEHVFLIIKENRTYDQVLGDLGRGNG
ncbi:MAG: YncE family protein, partial [Terriglobia bacterium]